MASKKTVTQQTLIGERGIALIGRRCLEMGYLFHPRRVDHGIDGHIDLVEPGTGALLNLTLLVQSKAQDRPFPSETTDEFHYICDQRDLDLWLSGNAPVILVFSHPNADQAWWVNVKTAFPDATSRATRAIYVDKGSQQFDASAASALLQLAQPKTSGLYLRPPPIDETLTTNLMPVLDMPPIIYRAKSRAKDYPSAGAILRAEGARAAGWILRNGNVYSSKDLREHPSSLLAEGPVEEIPTTDWAASTEQDTLYRLMDLLSRAMQEAYPELRWHKGRSHLHFRATKGLGPRKAGKGPRSRGRTVFGPHYAKSDPQRVSYYHHAAVRSRFRRLDTRWYCQIEPDYCFTADGFRESSFADSLLAGIKRLERHAAVAGWLRAWGNHLARDPDLFSPPRPVRLGPPETLTVHAGIDDRWWGPAPKAADSEENESEAVEPSDVALEAADIDTADLLSLLEPPPDVVPRTGPRRRRRRRHRRTEDHARAGS